MQLFYDKENVEFNKQIKIFLNIILHLRKEYEYYISQPTNTLNMTYLLLLAHKNMKVYVIFVIIKLNNFNNKMFSFKHLLFRECRFGVSDGDSIICM